MRQAGSVQEGDRASRAGSPASFPDKPYASSSIGRAAVSKTAGWGFESLLACHSMGPAPPGAPPGNCMNTKVDTTSGAVNPLDVAKYAAAILIVAAGIAGWYLLGWATPLKVLLVLLSLVAAVGPSGRGGTGMFSSRAMPLNNRA